MRRLIVFDTNVYVSRLLQPFSIPARAVLKGLELAKPPISTPTWTELQVVLRRKKFAPYIKPEDIKTFLAQIWELALLISDPPRIRACRDPRDDKFLELAVHGRADAIITGDQDLLELNPFRGIAILTPKDYLDLK
jgi:putative PIN family toxin of toxin-antitoxin system